MKNPIQFQKGLSLNEFMRQYGTEAQCEQALFSARWPHGFVCPECGYTGYCEVKPGKLYQCHRCHQQTSLTSGTIFACTKLALRRHLGIGYNAAWRLKHKLMQVMIERDNRRPLSGHIQLDDAYWGGERHGGKCGRGAPGKIPFLAAAQVTEVGHVIKIRLTTVAGFTKAALRQWAGRHLQPASYVVSDGLACFSAVTEAGCEHEAIVTGGGPARVTLEAFGWVNMALGNVKNAIHGTYHAISHKHLPRYLSEFCYRFNWRFQLEDLIPRLTYAAVRTPPTPARPHPDWLSLRGNSESLFK